MYLLSRLISIHIYHYIYFQSSEYINIGCCALWRLMHLIVAYRARKKATRSTKDNCSDANYYYQRCNSMNNYEHTFKLSSVLNFYRTCGNGNWHCNNSEVNVNNNISQCCNVNSASYLHKLTVAATEIPSLVQQRFQRWIRDCHRDDIETLLQHNQVNNRLSFTLKKEQNITHRVSLSWTKECVCSHSEMTSNIVSLRILQVSASLRRMHTQMRQ